MKIPSACLWYNPEIFITTLIGLLDFPPLLILLHRRIHNIPRPHPLLRPLHLHRRLGMLRQKSRQRIHINPDLVIPFLLRLIKNQLQPPVQMHNLNIIHILLRTIPRMPHIGLCQEQTKIF